MKKLYIDLLSGLIMSMTSLCIVVITITQDSYFFFLVVLVGHPLNGLLYLVLGGSVMTNIEQALTFDKMAGEYLIIIVASTISWFFIGIVVSKGIRYIKQAFKAELA